MIHTGDCLKILPTLPAESVQTCVTSPPYFGLRDYGCDGQIGLELDPAAYIEKLVQVFREVRRLLKPDGTLWLNLGDCYAGSGRGGNQGNATSGLQGGKDTQDKCRQARGSQKNAGIHEAACSAGAVGRAWVPPPAGFKNKDLMGIPWRVAFALQADGWWLRQGIVWHKPNPIPGSYKDRCTTSHEFVFLMSKAEWYFFDNEAIAEWAVSAPDGAAHAFTTEAPGQDPHSAARASWRGSTFRDGKTGAIQVNRSERGGGTSGKAARIRKARRIQGKAGNAAGPRTIPRDPRKTQQAGRLDNPDRAVANSTLRHDAEQARRALHSCRQPDWRHGFRPLRRRRHNRSGCRPVGPAVHRLRAESGIRHFRGTKDRAGTGRRCDAVVGKAFALTRCGDGQFVEGKR